MLYFIGLGLYDEKDITLKGLETAKKSDIVFAEFYTSKLPGSKIERIEKLIGKKVNVLSREEIEDGEIILREAKNKNIAFLVCGDPLISTTHIALRIEAEKRGIKSAIIHNASTYSAAISVSGLFNYKFGKCTTVPFFRENFKPKSFYYVIKENLERNLHTLLFLDIKERAMSIGEAIEIILDVEREEKKNVFSDDKLCIGLSQLGSFEPKIKAGKAKELFNFDFGKLPHTLIIPAELHFIEEEYLKTFAGLKI